MCGEYLRQPGPPISFTNVTPDYTVWNSDNYAAWILNREEELCLWLLCAHMQALWLVHVHVRTAVENVENTVISMGMLQRKGVQK